MTAWRFPEPPDKTVLTLRSIVAGQPILFVWRDERGEWYFHDWEQLCHVSELQLVPLRELVDADSSLLELADLPPDWQAWRTSADLPWEKESTRTLEKTLERRRRISAEMDRRRITLPPGSPSTTELIREDRER